MCSMFVLHLLVLPAFSALSIGAVVLFACADDDIQIPEPECPNATFLARIPRSCSINTKIVGSPVHDAPLYSGMPVKGDLFALKERLRRCTTDSPNFGELWTNQTMTASLSTSVEIGAGNIPI